MHNNGRISVTTRSPHPPSDADFAIYIDFKKGSGNPQRVFQAADTMIRAMQRLDKLLCTSVDGNIKPIMVLEDVETGSLRIWLKNNLENLDDDAIKKVDWRAIVGPYLVKAKYVVLEWLNQPSETKTPVQLSRQIQQIATETDVRRFPDYKPPAIQDIVSIVSDVENAKNYLNEGDKISYISTSGDSIDFDLSIKWAPETLADLVTKETNRFAPAPMILAVKKPDYLGNSRWDFRHGKKMISARIDDAAWLQQFQNREIDVRPGDALRCMVEIEHGYGYDNELVFERYTITKINSVLVNEYRQSELFDERDI